MTRTLSDVPEDVRRRYEITLQNAAEFFKVGASVGAGFTPMGVIQGWSADSMAEAACKLASMGYDYLAIGGTVPLEDRSNPPRLAKLFATLCPTAFGFTFSALGRSRNWPFSSDTA